MEEECAVKPSVAELAGRFKGHPLPMPTAHDEKRPIRKIPPCSLNFHKKDGDSEPERPAILSPTPKGKLKISPLFEKIQANLALSPTALSPDVKLQGSPFAAPAGPGSPCSPLPISPTLRQPPPQTLASEEEVPVSFEQPAEGTPLPSINKCRARLSFKRRPPTRQHRKSASEGPELSPTGVPNGDDADVFDAPAEGRSSPQPSVVKEASEEDDEGGKDAGEAQEKAASGGQDTDQKAPVETGAEVQAEKQQQQEQEQELDPEEVVMEESPQAEEEAARTIEEEGSSPEGGDDSGKN
ncbi:capZ-interacting protein [Sardina pilchardus]|uniref:capZ-interacting protein n=1 Tax=Sardina pilchardus TaxID=27697 RepID=UPI002E14FB50